MPKTYDKKPALAIGLAMPKDSDSEEDEGSEGDEETTGSLKSEALKKIGDVLGVPPERHAELDDALSAFIDAHGSSEDMPDKGEEMDDEPTEEHEEAKG